LLEWIPRVEQSGSVEDDHLRIIGGSNSDDTVAGGLWLRAGDAQLLADYAIEQRRLPDVGFSGDGYDSSAWHASKLVQPEPGTQTGVD
jgi:hypothetical protein